MAILERTDADFEASVQSGFYVVDLYGEQCIPCKMLAGVIQKVEAEMPFVDFIKVNISRNKAVAKKFHVDAVPMLLLMKDGQVIESHLGYMDEQKLSEMIGKSLYC